MHIFTVLNSFFYNDFYLRGQISCLFNKKNYNYGMNEIEIKARVKDREKLIEKLNTFCKYQGALTRDDSYWALTKEDKRKIRIRKETKENSTSYFITYKKKEQHLDQNGSLIEVNDEKESSLENPQALEAFLTDSGYSIFIQKHKDVVDWTLELEEICGVKNLTACFELCKVPPLGDFLEIEILSPSQNQELLEGLHLKLNQLIEKAGLCKEDIEPKYYSQLLEEYNEGK